MALVELDAGEEILFTIRKHWLQFFLESIGFIFAIILPPIVFLVAAASIGLELTKNVVLLAAFAYLWWLAFAWTFFFISWTDYYLDIWVITNKRLIDIEQRGLFVRDIASLWLEDMQDVKIEISGILSTLLKLGEIRLQTAAANQEFVIRHARNPEYYKEKIMALVRERYDARRPPFDVRGNL